MRNLFQVNVEEGTPSMVYLLQKYFGTDGREETEALCSAAPVTRIRRACWAHSEDAGLAVIFMFTYRYTDRDGKMQLEALASAIWL